MGYIGAHGIAALHRYKYSGVDHSYLAKYVLQPFWSRCVNFFPLWMPYIPLNWIRHLQDGFTLHTACFSSFTSVQNVYKVVTAKKGSMLLALAMSLLYLPFAIANALTARLNDGIPLVDEFWILLGFCVYSVSLYLHFATSVIHEITAALGISCFRITRKEA
nr:choline/ethanolaminephosphotransferase 1 [Ipomoea batatas]